MSWTTLSHRINHLPLILAGPILRRTEPDAVTVWVALKSPCHVTLKVYSTDQGKGEIINQLILKGSRSTVQLGKYLHIVALTAIANSPPSPPQPWGGKEEILETFLQRNLLQQSPQNWGGDLQPSPQNWNEKLEQSPQNWGGDLQQSPQNWNKKLQQSPQNWGGDLQQSPQNWGGDLQQSPQNWGGDLQQSPQSWGGDLQQSPQSWGGRGGDLQQSPQSWGGRGGDLEQSPQNWGGRGGETYLQPGQIYAYDMEFGDLNLTEALTSKTAFPNIPISYFAHNLPTFAMPFDDLNHIKIVHGSCRKPHGGGKDALSILDEMISEYANQPNSRPQQLFLTGDQIYGDDVADVLLAMVTDAGDTLLGWQEKLPIKLNSSTGYQYMNPSELKPGQRSDLAKDYGGFTAMLINKPDKAKSHLFGLGEYYTMYLFAWSQILWPDELPQPKDIHNNFIPDKLWPKEAETIKDFAKELWKTRRLLANIPTYMICDDHDISDDWYLNREWCNRVLSKPLGRRTVQNGLLAYAVFQAWGNTPDQFKNSQSGEKLLENAETLSLLAGNDDSIWQNIARYLGIPDLNLATNLPQFQTDEDNLILNRDYPDQTKHLDWHYTIRSYKHEVIVLDTRTWRGYPQGEDKTIDPPMLLSHIAFAEQITKPLQETSDFNIEVTLLIVPTNLVSLKIIDLVQQSDLEKGNVFNTDAGDSWNFHETAFSLLLAELFKQRDRIIILSGDIHYSAAVRLHYWCNQHFGETQAKANSSTSAHVLAQLTASAFKNAELSTQIAHTKAKSLFAEKPQYWAGWNLPPELIEIQVIQEIVRILKVKLPDKKPIVRQINNAEGNGQIAWNIMVKNNQSLPDWQYKIEWIKRQPSQEAAWQKKRQNSKSYQIKNWWDIITLLWRNRWLQEGEEIVGYSNIALVTFQWENNRKSVIQDTYWHPLWQPDTVVYSRYFVPLNLDEKPPELKVFEA